MLKYVTHVRHFDGAITHLFVGVDIMTQDECIREIEMHEDNEDVIYKTAPAINGVPHLFQGAEIHVVKPEDGKKVSSD